MPSIAQGLGSIDGLAVLRIACGAFFVPHIYAKFFVPEALGFFAAAGFKPARTWMYVSCAIEIVAAIGLILGLYTTLAGLLAGIHLLIAAAAVWKVTRGKWLWNIGGLEYCVFWAIACFVVALHG